MRVVATSRFSKSTKRLHANQKHDLDRAVEMLMRDPAIGTAKTGDLAGVRVHKFRMLDQLTLLAYKLDSEADTLYLLDLGSHENFYRDLKHS